MSTLTPAVRAQEALASLLGADPALAQYVLAWLVQSSPEDVLAAVTSARALLPSDDEQPV